MAFLVAAGVFHHDERVFASRLNYHTGENLHDEFSEKKFLRRYRLSRPMVHTLTEGYSESEWGRKTARNFAIPDAVQVSI
jgi:hypothetical protein